MLHQKLNRFRMWRRNSGKERRKAVSDREGRGNWHRVVTEPSTTRSVFSARFRLGYGFAPRLTGSKRSAYNGDPSSYASARTRGARSAANKTRADGSMTLLCCARFGTLCYGLAARECEVPSKRCSIVEGQARQCCQKTPNGCFL